MKKMILNVYVPIYNLEYKESYNRRKLCFFFFFFFCMAFSGDSDGKESICNVGDKGSIPGLGRSPAEGNGNTFQHFCLENFMDRVA